MNNNQSNKRKKNMTMRRKIEPHEIFINPKEKTFQVYDPLNPAMPDSPEYKVSKEEIKVLIKGNKEEVRKFLLKRKYV